MYFAHNFIGYLSIVSCTTGPGLWEALHDTFQPYMRTQRCCMVAECIDTARHKNRTSRPDKYDYKILYDKAYDVTVKATGHQYNIHTYR